MLALTTSSNDSEALAAIRKANDIVKGENLLWSDVLAQQQGTAINISLRPARENPQDWMAPHLKDKVVIDLMFRAIFAQPRTSNEEFWQFMDSVHNQWQANGSLTPAQYTAIRRCYSRAIKAA